MNRFCYNVYSQNGEDGVINALLAIFRIRHGWVCEFGAWDGRYLSNTFNLVENGFSGVFIEGDFGGLIPILMSQLFARSVTAKRSPGLTAS